MKRILLLIVCTLLVSTIGFAQTTVTGKVTSSDGENLPGAFVVAKGTSNGTITGVNGDYQLTLEQGQNVIAFSFIGYVPKEITVGGETEINVSLEVDAAKLDDIVVIGYGEVEKSDLTGSIVSITPDAEDADQVTSVETLIQGRAAGVQVTSLGSEPGAPASIRIRGVNSLTSNTEPLYVIDGIIVNSATEDTGDPLTGGSSYLAPQSGLSGINPKDIANIEILKDASATAIYGSRGANGVVLITTKTGNSDKAKFNYSGTTRIGQVTNLFDVLDMEQYINYNNDGRLVRGFEPTFYKYDDGTYALLEEDEAFMLANSESINRLEEVNWQDEIYQTSISQNHRLAISGGDKDGNYYIAGGYAKSEGVISPAFASKGDLTLNMKQKLSDRFNLRFKVAGEYNKLSSSKGTDNLGSTNSNIVRQITSGIPILDYDYVGDDFGSDVEDLIEGPRSWISGYDDESNEFRTLAAFTLDYDISDVFTYRAQLGGDYRGKERAIWYGTELFRGQQANGEAGLANFSRFRYNIDNTIMFKKNFNRKHRINGTVGTVLDQSTIERESIQGSGFANKSLRADGLRFAQVLQPLNLNRETETIVSYLARANYNYRNLYSLTATYRADGSSKFSEDNKYSHFPAFSLAWKAGNEKFLKKSKTISEAKLRLGWGLTGNQNIPNFRTITPYSPTANPYPNGQGGGLTALVPANLANPDLKWETTSQYNAGIDLSFFNGRINTTFDAYYKEVSDLLLDVQLGPSAGFESFYANQGDLTNKGLELSFNGFPIDNKNFQWEAFGNISRNVNEITDLNLDPGQFGNQTISAFLGRQVSGGNYFKVPANIFAVGQPIAQFYGFKTNGIISDDAQLAQAPSFRGTAAQKGDIFVQDLNGDGNVDDSDLTIIGDPNPDFTFGFGSTFTYKNFNINFLANGVVGNDIANGNTLRDSYAIATANNNIRTEAYLDAWSEGNPNGSYPRVGYDFVTDTGFTDRLVEDGSFLRLSYATLSYDFPVATSKLIQGANLSFTGNNLLLITDYSGFDPEVDSFSFDPGRVGIDMDSFPNQKAFTIGLNVTF